MTERSPAIEEASSVTKTDQQSTPARSIKVALLFSAGCFALALAAALLQNLRQRNLETSVVFDSGAYLMTTKYILAAARHLQNGMALDTAIKSIAEFVMLDGPVLPGLSAAFFTIIGKEPSILDMRAPMVLQGIFHACAAALIAMAGWRFTGGRIAGLCAGIVFAVWPPAIIGAARFLTETVTTLFISAGILACSFLPAGRVNEKLKISPVAGFALGCLTALLYLVKAALAPAALLEIAGVFLIVWLSNVDRRSYTAAILSAAAGFSLIVAPWLLFSRAATGEFCLTTRRMPAYNLAVGLNPETDGWGSLPDTPLVKLFSEADGPTAIGSALYRLNPGDFYGRMARKPARLFQFPWNDFKVSFLGIPVAVQVIAHQIVVVFGLFGLIAFAALPLGFRQIRDKQRKSDLEKNSTDETRAGPSKPVHPELEASEAIDGEGATTVDLSTARADLIAVVLIGAACLSIIAGHLAYLPFVADARYGFTATPCFILLAAWCLTGQMQHRIKQSTLTRLCIAASFIILAFSLRDYVWRSFFATTAGDILASSLTLGALLLFIGCITAIRALLGPGRANAPSKFLALMVSYLSLTVILASCLLGRDIPYDWEAKLNDKEEFCRTVKLPRFNSNNQNAIVVMNLKGDWRAARLKVNGQEIQGPAMSILNLTALPNLSNDFRSFSWILHSDTAIFDQWRAFIVPPAYLKPGADNIVSLTGDAKKQGAASLTGSTTSGAQRKEGGCPTVTGPSVDVFSATKLCNSPFSTDPRFKEALPPSVASGVSSRTIEGGRKVGDLSAAPGQQNGQYHLFLLVGQNKKANSGQAKKIQPIYTEMAQTISKAGTPARKMAPKSSFTASASIDASAFQGTHVRFKLTGEAESAGPLNFRWHLHDLRLLQGPLELAAFPSKIAGTGKRSFTLEAIARADAVDAQSAFSMIKFSSDLVPLSISKLRLEVEPLAAPELAISGKSWF